MRDIDLLRDPATIRQRCANILAAVIGGRSAHFTVDLAALDAAAEAAERATRRRYPDLRIPYHSRWRHFEAGGIDRRALLDARLAGRDVAQRARSWIDLTVVSVLLDAGAGAAWTYKEPRSGQRHARSEGLAVASFDAFLAGTFSSDPADPLRADAGRLQHFDADAILRIFQAGDGNALVGHAGRAELLRRLGRVLAADPERFGTPGRPGGLFDLLSAPGGPGDNADAAGGRRIPAASILREIVAGLAPIWPSGSVFEGQPLGDAWRHPAAGGTGASQGWVPFHKLSQWLCYSLLEPFEWAGKAVSGLEALTALPEYRNGGLLLDTGVVRPRSAGLLAARHGIADEAVVEWRALTVALIDALAPRLRRRLLPDLDPAQAARQLPLACLLEGGTWAAGRELAQSLRAGEPPLTLDSDGTVF